MVYLDADCMAVGSLEPLFRMPRGLIGTVGAKLPHHRRGSWSETPSSRKNFAHRADAG